MSTQTDEQHVREVIDTAMSGTRPPHDLAAGALAQGRRLRGRRRAGYAAVGVAASVALAVAVPWVASGGDRPVHDSSLVATEPPAPVPPGPQGWWDMPSEEMVSAVEAILPDGVVVTDPGPLEADSPEGGPASGWINPHLDAPGGPGSLNVILYPGAVRSTTPEGDGTVLAPSSGPGTGCEAPEHSGATTCIDLEAGDEVALTATGPDVDVSCGGDRSSDRARCEEVLDAQGNVIGRRLTERWTSGVVINEFVLRRDGGTVYAASANSLDDKWGEQSTTSAVRPPLSLDQLEDLVRNDVWVSYAP